MLTQRQRDGFRLAIGKVRRSQQKAAGIQASTEDLSDSMIFESESTIDDFFGKYGRSLTLRGTQPKVPHELYNTSCGEIYKWEKAKSREGERQGNLYVMDFGTMRAVYFEPISEQEFLNGIEDFCPRCNCLVLPRFVAGDALCPNCNLVLSQLD